MQLLEDMILKYGKVRGGNVLKVDGFLNHRLDTALICELGQEFCKLFEKEGITKVLTVESSGIAIAYATAEKLKVPLVFAKKTMSSNISDEVYKVPVHSYTHNNDYMMLMTKAYITSDDIVLLVDDFLANGCALGGLIGICEAAGAKIAGIGVAIEKGFQGGGDLLRQQGYRVESLAVIDKMDENTLEFRANCK